MPYLPNGFNAATTRTTQENRAPIGSMATGGHLFVVVDYYSRYMEVQVLKSTTTNKIIRSLKSMFLSHGPLVSITIDNGPQFLSQEFQRFVEDECIDVEG